MGINDLWIVLSIGTNTTLNCPVWGAHSKQRRFGKCNIEREAERLINKAERLVD